jgi:hypothetical protein
VADLLGVEAGGEDAVLAVAYRSGDGWEAVDVTPFDDGGAGVQGQPQQQATAAAG